MRSARTHTRGVAIAAALVGLGASAPAETIRFDITETGLGIFGLQFTSDFLTPVEDVQDMRITETRMHLEFSSDHPFGNIPDAADIAVQFQAPIVDIARILTVSGADLGWSGTGSFVGDATSTLLNDDILDFSDQPPGAFALWFMRIVNLNDDMPRLGGNFANSYIEVDLAPIPEPATLLSLTLIGLAATRRR